MSKKENLISSIIFILLGIMLMIMKGGVISFMLTVLGVTALVLGVIDIVDHRTNPGIVKLVIGLCVIIFGWMFVNLAFYILAAVLLLQGISQIVNINKYSPVNLTTKERIIICFKPAITVIAGACLLFNQGGTIAWIFWVVGILLVVEGVLGLINSGMK